MGDLPMPQLVRLRSGNRAPDPAAESQGPPWPRRDVLSAERGLPLPAVLHDQAAAVRLDAGPATISASDSPISARSSPVWRVGSAPCSSSRLPSQPAPSRASSPACGDAYVTHAHMDTPAGLCLWRLNRRQAEERGEQYDGEHLGQRCEGEDAAVGVAKHRPEGVIHACPTDAAEDREQGNATETD